MNEETRRGKLPDLERTIRGLFEMAQRCTWKDIDEDRHRFQGIINGALTLLRKQKPRVMALDEVKEAAEQEKPMYVHEAKFPESTRWLIPKNAGHYGFEERGSGCQFNYYDYLSKQIGGFCCWTAEPTDEQKEMVKWDG